MITHGQSRENYVTGRSPTGSCRSSRTKPSDARGHRDDLGALCRGITHSLVHLETRDAYGTEVELTHWAKWLRGEPDGFGWLDWWLEMLRGHRTAGCGSCPNH